MNTTTIFSDKKSNSEKIKKQYGILMKYKPVGLIILSDSNIISELIEGLKTLQSGVIVYSKTLGEIKISENVVVTSNIDEQLLVGFDFVLCDDEIQNLGKYLEKGIVPIVTRKNHMSSLLREFNPLKNEGNAFFYDETNVWNIFYSLIRYLENYKFPFDNKNLVNNILKV
ncbi:MAG: hypothetical protein PHS49_05765 [Candidatus Gracilibacteria bacterium]|nr:hypothetical protein [Candidatus Gracilibacteria bacterium]